MAWVKLDDQFADHPKIVAAGPLASWLYVCGLTYSARLLTDGFIPTGQVRKLADVKDAKKLAEILVNVGLWEAAEDGSGYRIHDYLDYNPSRDKTLAVREERAKAGERGGKQKASNLLERSQAAASEMLKQNSTPYPIPSPAQELTPETMPRGVSKPPARAPAREAVFSPTHPVLSEADLLADAMACETTPEIYTGFIPQWRDKRQGSGKTSADWRADLRAFVRAANEITRERARAPTNGHRPMTFGAAVSQGNAEADAEFGEMLKGSQSNGARALSRTDEPIGGRLPRGNTR